MNLYIKPKAQGHFLLASYGILQLGAVFIMIMLAIGIVQLFKSYTQTTMLQQAIQEKTITDNQLLKFTKEHPQPKDNPVLNAKIRLLQAEKEHNTLLMSALEKINSMNLRGFSVYFDAFSSQWTKGIALTEFKLRVGGKNLELTGVSRSAETIPILLQKLSLESIFFGIAFDHLTIDIDDKETNGLLKFSLQTRETSLIP